MLSRTSFWATVALLFCGSVSCFGYAGVQAFDSHDSSEEIASTATTSSLSKIIRTPIHFERHLTTASIAAK